MKKKPPVRKGKFICLPNTNRSSVFVYNQEISLRESINTEFKYEAIINP